MDSNKIELREENGMGEIKIDGIKIKNVSSYNVKRDANKVDITLTMCVPKQNFRTTNFEQSLPGHKFPLLYDFRK